jgi:hypothetical protein
MLMPVLSDRCPRMVMMHQRLYTAPLDSRALQDAVRQEIRKLKLHERVKAGGRVALSCGSRGIASIALIAKTTVEELRTEGFEPFIFPAMGSHGGATAEGQIGVLASLGITEEFAGCKILSSMETVVLGKTKHGLTVYLDKNAAAADAIIVLNRVKPHTNFRGEWESGLFKMMAIGMGKHDQAIAIHRFGVTGLRDYLPEVAKTMMQKSPIVAGLAILEDACHSVCRVVGLRAEEIEARERELLREVRDWSPKLPIKNIDLLVVDQIGKEISGMGMDSNVTGRCALIDNHHFPEPYVRMLIALDLTAQTHGNATGMGVADVITRRLMEKVDWKVTYTNCLTGLGAQQAAMPYPAESDREAIRIACDYMCAHVPLEDMKAIRIRDTLSLETMWVSEAVQRELQGRDGFTFEKDVREMTFSADGRLPNIWGDSH